MFREASNPVKYLENVCWGVGDHWGNISLGHLNYGGKYLKFTVTIDLLVMKGMGMFSDFCFNIQFVNFLFFFLSKSLNISYFSALSETKNQETIQKKSFFPPIGMFKFQSLT